MYKELRDLIFELAKKPGTAGDEHAASHAALEKLSRYMPATLDALGNVRGELAGPGAHIMLEAHIDQIGLIVTRVDDNGFVMFEACGGADTRVLEAHEVTVWGKSPLFGVVVTLPPHLSKKEDAAKAKDMSDLAIDTGLPSGQAMALIRPGDRITLNGGHRALAGNRICGPALDDRIGVAAVLRCLELLKEKPHDCRLSVVFSVQEETGGSGAAAGGYSSQAGEALVVDVSFASAPDIPKEKSAELGKGPMPGIAPSLDTTMWERLLEIAEQHRVPAQVEVMGGGTGTDADKIQNAGAGIRAALISIPLRNMHTAVEIADLTDVENAAVLMAQYIAERGKNA